MKTLSILLMVVLTGLSVAAFAQDTTKQKIKTEKQQPEKMKYCCPMHPEVTSDKPGKCSKCGKDMKMPEKKKPVKSYSCPKHPDIESNKPGKCPKCGNELNRSPKEKMKMEVMKMYTCPMHQDVTSDKPGKCPQCGMDLKEKKDDHDGHHY